MTNKTSFIKIIWRDCRPLQLSNRIKKHNLWSRSFQVSNWSLHYLWHIWSNDVHKVIVSSRTGQTFEDIIVCIQSIHMYVSFVVILFHIHLKILAANASTATLHQNKASTSSQWNIAKTGASTSSQQDPTASTTDHQEPSVSTSVQQDIISASSAHQDPPASTSAHHNITSEPSTSTTQSMVDPSPKRRN